MTENTDKCCGRNSADGKQKEKTKNDVECTTPPAVIDKEHEKYKDPHDRLKRLTQLLIDKRPISSATRARAPNLQQPSLSVTTASNALMKTPAVSPTPSISSSLQQQSQIHQHLLISDELRRNTFYRTVCASFQSATLLLDMHTGDFLDHAERSIHKDEFGTQRVYKKTSPNCVLTLYLPTREITLSGNSPSILRGIIYVDPKAIQGYRVYAQLTLTFRYGREDEEVMGLRFCNEAIMSLHQVWPRNEEPTRESLSPLQEALVKRLGEGAHPFTLTLTPQAPPSVQLVPAKRYYGAPIGTSYDVRCFIADKTDEKFHRRASVKMGVRVIYRTDVFHHVNGPENFAALVNSPAVSQHTTELCTSPPAPPTAHPRDGNALLTTRSCTNNCTAINTASGGNEEISDRPSIKPRKSERGDSFPKLRLSPKSFRFSGRFGRSKSEIEKCPNDPFYNYSKSFQEQYDTHITSGSYGSGLPTAAGGVNAVQCHGPQGAVDKPFLLQDGRVGLRASLDKSWYTHGEDVCVTINIKNDSRKTVRKVRVCAIQHVDVCMFNNGKFKNIVADSDINSPVDRTVPPGGTLNTTIVLKPQRGQTKNWIALEDTLQRSTEPEEITGAIAASAIRSPNLVLPTNYNLNPCPSPAVGIPQPSSHHGYALPGNINDDRNVFAIYVSYYVKVKLTLSGMGGELSLKLPFVLVHVDEQKRDTSDLKIEKLTLDDVPCTKKTNGKVNLTCEINNPVTPTTGAQLKNSETTHPHVLDRIESIDDDIRLSIPSGIRRNSSFSKRRLVRSETLAKDIDEDVVQCDETTSIKAQSITTESITFEKNSIEMESVHVVQIHTPLAQAHILPEREREIEDDGTTTNETKGETEANVTTTTTTLQSSGLKQLSQENDHDKLSESLKATETVENVRSGSETINHV